MEEYLDDDGNYKQVDLEKHVESRTVCDLEQIEYGEKMRNISCLICKKELFIKSSFGSFDNPLLKLCDKCHDKYGFIIAISMKWAAAEEIKKIREEVKNEGD